MNCNQCKHFTKYWWMNLGECKARNPKVLTDINYECERFEKR